MAGQKFAVSIPVTVEDEDGTVTEYPVRFRVTAPGPLSAVTLVSDVLIEFLRKEASKYGPWLDPKCPHKRLGCGCDIHPTVEH